MVRGVLEHDLFIKTSMMMHQGQRLISAFSGYDDVDTYPFIFLVYIKNNPIISYSESIKSPEFSKQRSNIFMKEGIFQSLKLFKSVEDSLVCFLS